MSLTKKLQENTFRHNLFERGETIVVGCSGGPDSVCLLDILRKLKSKYKLSIVIAHVNYGLRGDDSRKDEKLVADLAKKYHLPLEIKKVRCSELRVSSSENSLRNIRYEFFEKIRTNHRAQAIAVGHNLDDQAETVMQRILRGTGLRGLSAIKFRNGYIIRPLLNISRKEILAHLSKNNLPYRKDKSNLDLNFTRNKIRHRLMPYLKKNFNPNIENALCSLASSASDDYEFIKLYSLEWLLSQKKLSVSKIKKLHPAIKREVLRQAIEKYCPNLREIELRHIEEILKIVESNKSKGQVASLKGLKIKRKGDNLVIEKS